METLKQDIIYAFRQMSRNLGFTLAVILILSMGIGANTAVFSVASQVLLRSLPFRDSDRVVHIRYGKSSLEAESILFSVPEFKDFQAQSKTFSGQMEYHSMPFILIGRGDPDRLQVGVVSANALDVLGVRPIQGRGFRADDEQPGAPPVMLLSYSYWRNKFGSDRGIVGQTLQMNGQPITVVGILPPLPQYPGPNDAYIPTSACPFRSNTRAAKRDNRMLSIFGRLKPGVSLEQAQADILTTEGRLRKDYPASYPDAQEHVSVAAVEEEMISTFRPTLLILLGTVVLVLLLTCANVAILYSVRLLSRKREIVVRAALGAGRGRIIRQLLTEGVLLSLLGGIVGLGLAAAGTKPLALYAQRFTPLAEGIGIDGRVLAFTLVVSLLTGLLFGLIPALQIASQDLVSALKEGTGRSTVGVGRHRFRNVLVLLQVAVSFVLLIAAGLAIRSTLKLQEINPGFQVGNILSLSIDMPLAKYKPGTKLVDFYTELFEKLGALPGVVSVGAATSVPLSGEEYTPTFRPEDRPTPPGQMEPRADLRVVSRGYFHTVGIPVLRGRVFAESDVPTTPIVTVVNQSMAQRYWPHTDPVGKRVLITNFQAPVTVIGVVGDTRQNGLAADPSDAFYFAFRQMGGYNRNVLVRTQGDPNRLIPAIREVVRSIDPEQPIDNVQTLEELRSKVMAPMRVTATLLGLFGVIAFIIMMSGISCAVAIGVSERRQEIGIRSALGAKRGDVLGLVLKQGIFLVLAGLALGIILALAAGRLLSGILYGVQPTDPATFVLVALAILLIAAAACLLPARRATSIEPSLILRG